MEGHTPQTCCAQYSRKACRGRKGVEDAGESAEASMVPVPLNRCNNYAMGIG